MENDFNVRTMRTRVSCANKDVALDPAIEQILAASRTREDELREVAQVTIGDLCDAVRGFLDTASDWKTIAETELSLDLVLARTDWSVARAYSLSVLGGRILEIACDIPRLLLADARLPAMAIWRALVEAKNIAFLIDINSTGPTGLLWNHYGIIEHAKAYKNDSEAREAAEQSKRSLKELGFEYKSRAREPWAIGADGGNYNNAVCRCRYVWANRSLPNHIDDELRARLASVEEQLIRRSNAVVHPSMLRHEIQIPLGLMIISSIVYPMEVIQAYKSAASEVLGWSSDGPKEEQFHVYPSNDMRAFDLSLKTTMMYYHCLILGANQFLED